MATLSPDRIFEIASGFMAAKHLFAANEIALFEQLASSAATLDDLATRTGVPRRTLRIVADAMVALGLVERAGDLYQNSPIATTFLSGRSAADLRPFLRLWNHLSYPRWITLEKAVRTAEPLYGSFRFTEEEQRIFSEGVEAATAGVAQALAATYEFDRHRRLLDLGGGTGSFLLAVLERCGALEATLYELPSAAMVARQRLAGHPLGRCVRIVEGNFLEDPIPDGHDAIIVANVVHGFSPERNLALLKRLRRAVPDGARLLLVDFWTDPTHTEPLLAALMAGEFLVHTGEGDVYSEGEARQWLHSTGWRSLERRPLVGPSSVIVAEAAA